MRDITALGFFVAILNFPVFSHARNTDLRYEALTGGRFSEFFCLADVGKDDLEPEITWEIPKGSRLKSWPGAKNNNILMTEAARATDAGNYTCTARHSNGTVISKTTINVCFTPSVQTTDKPGGGMISDETYAPLGGSITLKCKASVGTPKCRDPFKYTLTWSKVLQEYETPVKLTSTEDVAIIDLDDPDLGYVSGELKIKRVQSSDYGIYLCNITNENGYLVRNVTVTDEEPQRMKQARLLWIICGVIVFLTLIPFWFFRFQHSLASIKLICKKFRANSPGEGDEILYDVLVVHGPSAFEWVWKFLQPKLEETFQYKCFIPDRDTLGGEDFYKCTAEVVARCKCIMIVVTPCILEHSRCLYSIMQASDSLNELLPSNNVFIVILQSIKNKEFTGYPKRAMNIINNHKSKSLKVPKCCQQRAKEKDIEHNQMKENMIIGVNGGVPASSKEDPENEGNIGFRDVRIQPIESKEKEQEENRGKVKLEVSVDFVFESNLAVDEESPPETPTSTTDIVYCKNSSQKEYVNLTFFGKMARILFNRDLEELFWKRLRLRLPVIDVQSQQREEENSRRNSVVRF